MPEPQPIADRYPTKAELEAAFQAVRHAKVPQIPDVVLGLRRELERPEPDLGAAAELVAQDLAMAGQVLKTINSPLFHCRSKISSLHQAVAMMGLKRLTNLVTAEAVHRILSAMEGSARVVWESIMERARATVAIARLVEGANADETYLFGMMHDVGSLIYADRLDDYGTAWVLRNAADPQALLRFERDAIGVDHAAVGFLLAGTWRLPEHLALAIYHHHTPVCSELLDVRVRSLVAMAKLAQYLVALTNGNHELAEVVADRDNALLELSIDDDGWSALCDQALAGGWSCAA